MPKREGYHRRFGEWKPSEKQHRVLDGVAAGLTNAEIAVRLAVSPETVKSHVSEALAGPRLLRPSRRRPRNDRDTRPSLRARQRAAISEAEELLAACLRESCPSRRKLLPLASRGWAGMFGIGQPFCAPPELQSVLQEAISRLP